ncbi:type I-F CRISPR-associated endoribonuclease Cas6/Csy4 [Neisseriaceae bacterium CLB008]|nr:type I-F CRISPR-associated endoribonuclease Cas6/Csy4 [Neisseriaceae bacterium]
MSMLTHYFELKAIPHAELTQTMVISHLMQLLHQHLPAFEGSLGLGFPAYGQLNTLGGIIRVHGPHTQVANLAHALQQQPDCMDYALLSQPEAIPLTVSEHHCFQRVHTKGRSDFKRAQKRLMAQGKWSEEVAHNMTEKFSRSPNLPHIHLRSLSTKQPNFMLYIKRSKLKQAVDGSFNAYGLSLQASVPVF